MKYQVRYVNEAGTDILPIETHYGANGTRQVVSFKHVEGYLPDAYNRIGTLQKGTTTVFTFIYSPVPEGAANVVVVPGAGGAAAAGGAGAAGAGAAGAGAAGAAGAGGAVGAGGAAGAAIADGAVPAAGPADVVDIDNGDTPTTDTPDGTTAIDDNKTPKASTNWGLIGGGAAVVAAIAAAVLAIARRRRDEETDE